MYFNNRVRETPRFLSLDLAVVENTAVVSMGTEMVIVFHQVMPSTLLVERRIHLLVHTHSLLVKPKIVASGLEDIGPYYHNVVAAFDPRTAVADTWFAVAAEPLPAAVAEQ